MFDVCRMSTRSTNQPTTTFAKVQSNKPGWSPCRNALPSKHFARDARAPSNLRPRIVARSQQMWPVTQPEVVGTHSPVITWKGGDPRSTDFTSVVSRISPSTNWGYQEKHRFYSPGIDNASFLEHRMMALWKQQVNSFSFHTKKDGIGRLQEKMVCGTQRWVGYNPKFSDRSCRVSSTSPENMVSSLGWMTKGSTTNSQGNHWIRLWIHKICIKNPTIIP